MAIYLGSRRPQSENGDRSYISGAIRSARDLIHSIGACTSYWNRYFNKTRAEILRLGPSE